MRFLSFPSCDVFIFKSWETFKLRRMCFVTIRRMRRIFHFDITEQKRDWRRTDGNFSDVCKRNNLPSWTSKESSRETIIRKRVALSWSNVDPILPHGSETQEKKLVRSGIKAHPEECEAADRTRLQPMHRILQRRTCARARGRRGSREHTELSNACINIFLPAS